MFRKALPIIALAASLVLTNQAANAHPHLWIDTAATVLFEHGKVTGIRFQWTFDEFFSAGVSGEFDKNNNQKFDPDEIEPLRQAAFEATKEFGYFTDIRIDGKRFKVETTKDFTARLEKSIVIYEFTVPLPEPIDAAKKSLFVSVYDDSYFVDIGFIGHEPFKLTGDGSDKCTVIVETDRDNPIYGGVVYPKKANLQCK